MLKLPAEMLRRDCPTGSYCKTLQHCMVHCGTFSNSSTIISSFIKPTCSSIIPLTADNDVKQKLCNSIDVTFWKAGIFFDLIIYNATKTKQIWCHWIFPFHIHRLKSFISDLWDSLFFIEINHENGAFEEIFFVVLAYCHAQLGWFFYQDLM